MKKIIIALVFLSVSASAQVFFVSPDISIGAATANKDYKGEFGIGGRLGVGLKFTKYHFSLVGGFSNFSFKDKGFYATDERGNQRGYVNTDYSSTYIDLGLKAVIPIYAPNNDGLYFSITPEYNKLNAISFVSSEENKSNSPYNREGYFSKTEIDRIGNSFSIDLGLQYRIVGKNEFAFGASYKKQLTDINNYPSLGFFAINVLYQFNFQKSNPSE